MNRASFLAPFLAVLVLATAFTVSCGDGDGDGDGDEPVFGDLESEPVAAASNANAIAFTPDGRLFFGEQWTGDVKVVSAEGELLPEPFAHLEDVAADVRIGITGLAIDPEFESNHYVYVFYTRLLAPGPPREARPAIVRFTESENKGTERTDIVTELPDINAEAAFNGNGSIHFGPDGFLYLTLGDNDMTTETGPQGLPLPQDLGTATGKMLRVSKEDGSAAPDNAFAADPAADPRIYALGFRVPFDFTFHPETGRLYGSDNSGSSCEELNIVDAGMNSGWLQMTEAPPVDCITQPGNPPIHSPAKQDLRPEDFGSTVGVTGMEFVSADVYPVLGDSLVFCEAGTQRLVRVVLAPPDLNQVTANDVIARDCWLDVTVSPDGVIYYANLHEIRRLNPPPETPSPAPDEGSPSPE